MSSSSPLAGPGRLFERRSRWKWVVGVLAIIVIAVGAYLLLTKNGAAQSKSAKQAMSDAQQQAGS